MLCLVSVTHVCVLVFVDPVEVKRLVVDEKLCAGDFNGPNSHRKSVNVRLSVLCGRLNLQNQINPSHFNIYRYSVSNWNRFMHEKYLFIFEINAANKHNIDSKMTQNIEIK